MNPDSASLVAELPVLAKLPWHHRRLVDHLARLGRGRLHLRIGGHSLVLRGDDSGLDADISVVRPGALLRRLFWRGDLGFAESFIAGDWTSNDPAGLLELLAVNLDAYEPSDRRSRLTQLMLGLDNWDKQQNSAA